MNRQIANAKVSALPVDQTTINAVIAQTIGSNVLPFPVRLEMIRDGEEPVHVECDSFLGMCESCGTPTYASDAPRIVDGEISCPECVSAELSWKQVPVAARRAA